LDAGVLALASFSTNVIHEILTRIPVITLHLNSISRERARDPDGDGRQTTGHPDRDRTHGMLAMNITGQMLTERDFLRSVRANRPVATSKPIGCRLQTDQLIWRCGSMAKGGATLDPAAGRRDLTVPRREAVS
jgi:hypothetical protein